MTDVLTILDTHVILLVKLVYLARMEHMKPTGKIARVAILGSALALFAAAPGYATAAHPAHMKATAAARIAIPTSCLNEGAVVCIYANNNFSLGPGTFKETNSNWGADLGSSDGACVAGETAASDNGGGWNDCVSSIANNTTATFWFYPDDNCDTTLDQSFGLTAGTEASSMPETTDGIDFNDAISSDSRSASAVDC